MATITLTALKDRVVQKLRVLANGATIDTNDAALVEAKYNELYEELNNSGHVDFILAGPITTSHSQHIIGILASRCADDFEVEESRLQRLMAEERICLGKLKEVSHQEYVTDEEPEYY